MIDELDFPSPWDRAPESADAHAWRELFQAAANALAMLRDLQRGNTRIDDAFVAAATDELAEAIRRLVCERPGPIGMYQEGARP